MTKVCGMSGLAVSPDGSLRNNSALVLILAAVLMTFSLPPAAAQTVPPPQGGLGSKSNYYLYHDGKPIMRLTVAVEITKEVVCDDIGFHLHLNADSPETAQTKWQQYVMGFKPDFKENGKSEGPMVGGSIEYFASPNSFNTKTPPGPSRISAVPAPFRQAPSSRSPSDTTARTSAVRISAITKRTKRITTLGRSPCRRQERQRPCERRSSHFNSTWWEQRRQQGGD